MTRKIKQTITAIILMMTGTLLLCVPAFAAYDPVTIEIPIQTSMEMTIVIENEDGSNYETKTVNGEGKVSFTFDEPGDYSYVVYQVPPKSYDGTVDKDKRSLLISIYDVEGAEVPTLSHVVRVCNMTTNEKPNELSFKNIPTEYPTKPSSTVNTGDPYQTSGYMAIFTVAALITATGILLMVLSGKKKKSE